MERKWIKKYLKNAYKVYSQQLTRAIIGSLPWSFSYIVVKQEFFIKIAKSHPEITKEKLFNFVKTLGYSTEIYQTHDTKLNFFRNIKNSRVHVVSIGKDNKTSNWNLVTSFEVDISSKNRRKYIDKIKKTGSPVFLDESGRTLRIPSSNSS